MNTILGTRTDKKPAYFEIITPQVAKVILNNNAGNRVISDKRVLEYVNKMKSGLYKEGTAEPLKISKQGRLLDGQHRLTALIKANLNVEFLVARDLDEKIFDVLDTGKNRGASDVLAMIGCPNETLCAAVIKTYTNTKSEFNERYKLSNDQVIDIYQKNSKKYDEVVRFSQRLQSKGKLLPASLIGGLMLLFSDKNESEAISFFEQLCRLKPVQNTTIDVLYEKLLKNGLSKTNKIPTHIKIKLIINAWNYFRQGKDAKMIKYIEKDGFPKVI